MVGKSNQKVLLIQIDASNFAEFEISEFEISRFDCTCISSGVAGHTPIRPGVKSIFRGKKIKKAKKLKKKQ